jgi:hypothetical protein
VPVVRVVALVLLAVSLAACSGGTTSHAAQRGGDSHETCALIAQLRATGQQVARTDVADANAFDAGLGDAVRRYATIVDELHSRVPKTLRPSLDRLRAAVQQYRFSDGVDDYAALQAYAASNC